MKKAISILAAISILIILIGSLTAIHVFAPKWASYTISGISFIVSIIFISSTIYDKLK